MKYSESARIVLSDQEIANPLCSLCPLIRFAHPAGSPMAIYLPSLGCGQSLWIRYYDHFCSASPLHGRRENPQGFDGAGVQRFDAFVDSWGDFRLAGVGHGEHFQLGIEIVDHVQRDGFGGFGFDGGAELQFPMVGGNKVQEVQADIFRGGNECFPFLHR